MFPTCNRWDVPSLRLDRQGAITAPVVSWGSVSRRVLMAGTWAFYVDDYRFQTLLRDPLQLTRTGCTSAVEVNVTIRDQTPRAEVLWATYRKRLAARIWQDAGIGVMVDLNVPERFREESMLGVPAGWSAFATRGYALRPADLASEHEFARTWSRDAILMVFGGGKSIERACRSLSGAVYVHAHMDQVRGEGRGNRLEVREGGQPLRFETAVPQDRDARSCGPAERTTG